MDIIKFVVIDEQLTKTLNTNKSIVYYYTLQ